MDDQLVNNTAEERYRSALELYRTTDMAVKYICAQTGTPVAAFRAYLRRCHRELMFARHGIALSPEEVTEVRLRGRRGQTAAAHAKYKDAIRACDDIAYIELNVSQIAHLFDLNPTALGNQLRNHYPEILERREKERHRRGVNDNLHRGAKAWCKEQYAEAVEHLRTTDDTVRQTAALFQLSYSGLREHLLYYYKDLLRKRADKRDSAKTNKVRGGLSGNGGKHEPTPQSVEKYREAVHLYQTTAMTHEEICAKMGVTVMGLRNHLRMWNRELMRKRHDAGGRKEEGVVCGMTKLANGRSVLARSAEKYDEVVRLYETTTEPLKSIARRLGLQYNSVGGFVRRNRPDAIEAHNRLVKQENDRRKQEKNEKEQAEYADFARKKEAGERERILQALRETGGHKRNAAKLLGISKSALYNKLKAYNLMEEF